MVRHFDKVQYRQSHYKPPTSSRCTTSGLRRVKVIGILGGIASGKSTVAAEFARLGCKVIDADKIAHELLDKKTVRKKIVGLFGVTILTPARRVSRRKLADIVFADKDKKKLAQLNKIIHPLVLARADRLIKQYSRQSRTKAIVLDMPLLMEIGWHKRCDRLIFVTCNRKKRRKRAAKMPFFDKNQPKTGHTDPLWRENLQISLDKKAGISDNIIDNNFDLSALVRQVAKIFSLL